MEAALATIDAYYRSFNHRPAVVAAAATAATAAALIWLLRRRSRRRPPPGPPGLPVFGNLFNLPRPTFLVANREWRKKYGELVSYRLGSRRFIVLNSYHAINEALATPEFADIFSGRLNSEYFKSITHGKGIVASEGELWKEHRRFALKVLRDFGFARSGTEESIQQELLELRDRFDATGPEGLETGDLICSAIANVISILLFGYRAGAQDDRFKDFLAATQDNLQGGDLARFIPIVFPIVYKIPGAMRLLVMLGIDVYKFKRNQDLTHAFCQSHIDAHRAQLPSVGQPNDFLDAFLMEQARLDGKKKDHTFDDFQLKQTLMELFVAGTDTTSNTIRWGILYAAIYPWCQTKLQAEIDSQVGSERLPEHRDRKRMPYTMAFIDEVQRFATLAPFAVFHRCTMNVKFMGYDISDDDLILTNLYGVHHDPSLWDTPDKFRPERFLDASGEYQASKHLVPFGVGQRACLGESLARQELFLFLTGIFQKHSVELHPSSRKGLVQVLVGSEGIVHAPGQHSIIFRRRKQQMLQQETDA